MDSWYNNAVSKKMRWSPCNMPYNQYTGCFKNKHIAVIQLTSTDKHLNTLQLISVLIWLKGPQNILLTDCKAEKPKMKKQNTNKVLKQQNTAKRKKYLEQ